MNFKRKIAWILLASLILGLFGSFTYLIGMETAVIKDFTGQTVQLDHEQRNALGACETLKTMIADTGARELPFEGVAPFITHQNLQWLAHLIKDERGVNQIPQDQYIELFKCADYMKAPKKVLELLADRIYEPLRKKITEAVNEDEKANLELLYETVESNLSYYPDFNALLKEQRDLSAKRFINPSRLSLHSDLFDKKKLRAIKGIEILFDQAWTKDVKDLRIEGHEISQVNFAQIKKAFPEIIHLSLKKNGLRHFTNIHASNIQIDLKNNPIESIIIDNPRSLNNTRILVDKNLRPVVAFNQSRFDKCAQWLEALKAQSTVAFNRDNMTEELIAAAVGISLMSIVCNTGFWLYDMYKEGKSFSSLDVRSYAKSQVMLAAGFTAPRVLWACINKMWRERNQIRYDLAQKAYREGDHVSINFLEPSVGGLRLVTTHVCPSKYAYNLFGKN